MTIHYENNTQKNPAFISTQGNCVKVVQCLLSRLCYIFWGFQSVAWGPEEALRGPELVPNIQSDNRKLNKNENILPRSVNSWVLEYLSHAGMFYILSIGWRSSPELWSGEFPFQHNCDSSRCSDITMTCCENSFHNVTNQSQKENSSWAQQVLWRNIMVVSKRTSCMWSLLLCCSTAASPTKTPLIWTR